MVTKSVAKCFVAKYRKAGLSAVALGIIACSVPALAQSVPTPYANGVMRFHDIVQRTSPEEVLQVFIDAWRRGDYFVAMHTLSVDAKQSAIEDYMVTFKFRLSPKDQQRIVDDVNAANDNDFLYTDVPWLFDRALAMATLRGALPFSFGPKVTLGSPRLEGTDKAVFDVATDGKPDRMTVALVRKKTGDVWKVDQISFEGSAPNKKPWRFVLPGDLD